ncbi:hypothetical protein BV25DRAFT_1843781, partial [Artomyces pyxidatus]
MPCFSPVGSPGPTPAELAEIEKRCRAITETFEREMAEIAEAAERASNEEIVVPLHVERFRRIEALCKRGGALPVSDFDCRGLAPLPGTQKRYWVSSPNMRWVPEVPHHQPDEVFGYYADGMLGPFELMKWPQLFDSHEPHGLAAPGNPYLLDNSALNGEPLPRGGGLQKWEDSGAPWFDFTSEDWARVHDIPDEEYGMLKPEAYARLAAAVAEAERVSNTVAAKYFPNPGGPATTFIYARQLDMRKATSRLGVPAKLGSVIQ